jgi:hypothetical protein
VRTDELIDLLARGAGPARYALAARRAWIALGAGVIAALLMMQMLYGVRSNLFQHASLPMFWMKLAFVAVLAGTGWILARRLGRPGAAFGAGPWMLAAPVAAIWALAAYELAKAEPAARSALVLGQTWDACPFRIVLLSVPAFVAMLWMLRGFAPTRPRLAGAVAGLCAGAVGATAYSFHCPELAAPFLGTWYVIGILIPAAAGALLGPRLLRW